MHCFHEGGRRSKEQSACAYWRQERSMWVICLHSKTWSRTEVLGAEAGALTGEGPGAREALIFETVLVTAELSWRPAMKSLLYLSIWSGWGLVIVRTKLLLESELRHADSSHTSQCDFPRVCQDKAEKRLCRLCKLWRHGRCMMRAHVYGMKLTSCCCSNEGQNCQCDKSRGGLHCIEISKGLVGRGIHVCSKTIMSERRESLVLQVCLYCFGHFSWCNGLQLQRMKL